MPYANAKIPQKMSVYFTLIVLKNSFFSIDVFIYKCHDMKLLCIENGHVFLRVARIRLEGRET